MTKRPTAAAEFALLLYLLVHTFILDNCLFFYSKVCLVFIPQHSNYLDVSGPIKTGTMTVVASEATQMAIGPWQALGCLALSKLIDMPAPPKTIAATGTGTRDARRPSAIAST